MINKGSTITLIFGTLILMALSIYTYHINNEIAALNTHLDREKLKYEALLSEKLSIEKSLMKARKGLSSIKISQSDLASRLSIQRQQLQNEISANRTLINKQSDSAKTFADSQKLIDSLTCVYSIVMDESLNLEAIISHLQDSLVLSHTRFQDQEERFKKQPSLDNVEVEALRNQRTISQFPRRANAVAVSFDLPVHLENLSYEVSGPNGLNKNSLEGDLTAIKLVKDQFTASLDGFDFPQQRQQLRITYSPERRPMRGKYIFTVLSNGHRVGNVHVNFYSK